VREKLSEIYRKLSDKPRVSIGLPVFNGEKYLEEALDSILGQIYTDFELIISDNASTDRTQQICRVYAAMDSRIRYYRNERNLGAAKNFNRVFVLSSGEYFKWAAYDDVLAPEFLSRCIGVLDQNPSIVLCHSKAGRIDEHGEFVGTYDHEMRTFSKKLFSQKPHERFGSLISVNNPCLWIFGVIHASALRMTSLMGNYAHADRNLLAEIGLIGQIYEIPEYLFFRREHPQAYTDKYIHSEHMNYRERLDWWETTTTQWINSSNLRNCLEYFRSVGRVSLKCSEKLLCYREIGKWFIREGWHNIGSELEKALLGRSKLGRKLTSPIKLILKRTVIPIIEKVR